MQRGTRCTRSQAAPNWAVRECLTLVNEINAIEGEWRQTLASFQKWQLVVENCNALEVNRSLNQCKKKWAELRSDYKKVEPWKEGYWSFDATKKKELGLPEGFDTELFKGIDRYVKKKGGDNNAEGPETDPESDSQTQANTNKFFWQTGPKKQRRKITRKRKIEESFHPWRTSVSINIKQEPSSLNEMPELPRNDIVSNVKLETESEDEREKMMCAELLKNTELIKAILQGNLAEDVDFKLADLKNAEAIQTDFTRLQGDKLIDCLGGIANTLNQLCELVQECN